jgi:hypothetical protein
VPAPKAESECATSRFSSSFFVLLGQKSAAKKAGCRCRSLPSNESLDLDDLTLNSIKYHPVLDDGGFSNAAIAVVGSPEPFAKQSVTDQ